MCFVLCSFSLLPFLLHLLNFIYLFFSQPTSFLAFPLPFLFFHLMRQKRKWRGITEWLCGVQLPSGVNPQQMSSKTFIQLVIRRQLTFVIESERCGNSVTNQQNSQKFPWNNGWKRSGHAQRSQNDLAMSTLRGFVILHLTFLVIIQ